MCSIDPPSPLNSRQSGSGKPMLFGPATKQHARQQRGHEDKRFGGSKKSHGLVSKTPKLGWRVVHHHHQQQDRPENIEFNQSFHATLAEKFCAGCAN
jgi:hypothetical protein